MDHRLLSVGAALAVACYNPNPDSCAIACGDQDTCPADFSCSNGFCAANGAASCKKVAVDAKEHDAPDRDAAGDGSSACATPDSTCETPIIVDTNPCVAVCKPAIGSVAVTFGSGDGSAGYHAYPDGSAADEARVTALLGSGDGNFPGSDAIFIGVERFGSGSDTTDFLEPGPPGSQASAPTTFWPGMALPASDGSDQCVLVTGSGWSVQDCDAQQPHPYVIFTPQ